MVPPDAQDDLGDENLRDDDLQEEIVLLGDVFAAAATAGEHLSDEQVDDALGLPEDEV